MNLWIEEVTVGVFDATTEVGCLIANRSVDRTLASPASLSWGTIDAFVGLAGGSGTQGTSIHGDHWETYDGDLHTHVKGNWYITVDKDVQAKIIQNRTCEISVNNTDRIHGNTERHVLGSEIDTVLGPSLETNVGVHTRVHQAQEHEQDITEFTQHKGFVGDWFWVRGELDAIHLATAATSHLDLYGTRVSAGIRLFDIQATHNEVKGLHTKVEGLESKIGGFENRLTGLTDQIAAVKTQVGALKPSFFGLRLGAFSIGFNQWM
jgi:hypothetical protein